MGRRTPSRVGVGLQPRVRKRQRYRRELRCRHLRRRRTGASLPWPTLWPKIGWTSPLLPRKFLRPCQHLPSATLPHLSGLAATLLTILDVLTLCSGKLNRRPSTRTAIQTGAGTLLRGAPHQEAAYFAGDMYCCIGRGPNRSYHYPRPKLSCTVFQNVRAKVWELCLCPRSSAR